MSHPTAKTRFIIAAFFFILISFGCRKQENMIPVSREGQNEQDEPLCYDCNYLKQAYNDVEDHATQLGQPINNPYLLDNIRQAYLNLNGHMPSHPFGPNYFYVEFKPANYQQLDKLEQEDIDLFDYPLDRKLLTEGDFFVQEGKSVEDIPSYYAVVEPGYHFPAGIDYQVISKMYIPENDPALEVEALRISGNLDEEEEQEFSNSQIDKKQLPSTEEESAGHSTPSVGACNHYPSGRITFQNILTGDHSYRGVRQLQVVVRRLFKVERMRTDPSGTFSCKKYFHNKYTILAKFKDEYARVSRMRPWAIHEQFFPIKINFGKWRNLDCGHEFHIDNPMVAGTIATSQWCAAIVQNGVIEHREMCKELNVGLPPMGITIMLSSKKGSGHGNTYMLNKMLHNNAAVNGTEVLVAAVVTIWSPVGAALAALATEAYKQRAPDIKYGYGDDPSYLTTDRYCELVYHELSHALHYNAVGDFWWVKLGLAENKNPGIGTYGQCCTDYSPRIALAEGWAYYMGHLLADKKWGMSSMTFPEQGDFDTNQFMLQFSPFAGEGSHIHFLESYDPHRAEDPNRWIPKGLFYDLSDAGIEPAESGIRDQVSGYTCKQFFGAMATGAKDINEFKLMLLSQNHNYEREEVDHLFDEYGY